MSSRVCFAVFFSGLLLACASGCGGSLAQPFEQMKGQPITVYRLQNYEPPPAVQNAPAATPFALPPQIQSWIAAGAAALPPGLVPPGLIPGAAPPPVAAQDGPRFHGFRILGWMAMSDAKQRTEVLDVFGHESSFQPNHGNCMYAEFGFSIAQPNAAPADVLVSLSCDQVQPFAMAWPYSKTGITADTAKRIVALVQASFGG